MRSFGSPRLRECLERPFGHVAQAPSPVKNGQRRPIIGQTNTAGGGCATLFKHALRREKANGAPEKAFCAARRSADPWVVGGLTGGFKTPLPPKWGCSQLMFTRVLKTLTDP